MLFCGVTAGTIVFDVIQSWVPIVGDPAYTPNFPPVKMFVDSTISPLSPELRNTAAPETCAIRTELDNDRLKEPRSTCRALPNVFVATSTLPPMTVPVEADTHAAVEPRM